MPRVEDVPSNYKATLEAAGLNISSGDWIVGMGGSGSERQKTLADLADEARAAEAAANLGVVTGACIEVETDQSPDHSE